MGKRIKCYSELIEFKTFEERLEYLSLSGVVGEDTFGFDRIFNQMFYKSKEWRHTRNDIIARDDGCDLGVKGYELNECPIFIHHMNPISVTDIQTNAFILLDQEFLISSSLLTHNAIHYGRSGQAKGHYVERTINDTCPWKKQ